MCVFLWWSRLDRIKELLTKIPITYMCMYLLCAGGRANQNVQLITGKAVWRPNLWKKKEFGWVGQQIICSSVRNLLLLLIIILDLPNHFHLPPSLPVIQLHNSCRHFYAPSWNKEIQIRAQNYHQLLILLVQPTTIPEPTKIYSPLRKKKMLSRPIFPCFSLLGPPINSLLRGRAQQLSEVAEVDTCPRYRLSPRNLPSSITQRTAAKERKKERRQSIFAKRKKKKRK